MKPIIIFIISFLSVLNIHSQVLNKRGEKVVRKIEICSTNDEKPYIEVLFNYNDDLELKEIIMNAPATHKIVWKKNGNSIERTEYKTDGKINKVYDVRYEVEDGLVKRRIKDVHGLGGFVAREDLSFQYNKDRKMTSIREFNYNREADEEFGEESYRHMEVFAWDYEGNVYTSGSIGWNWRKGETVDKTPINYKDRKYYVSMLNDTNIDLTKLCLKNRFETIEEITEWFGKHSTFIMEEDWPLCYEFSHDEKGNAVRVDIYKGRITHLTRKKENVMKFYY